MAGGTVTAGHLPWRQGPRSCSGFGPGNAAAEVVVIEVVVVEVELLR